MQGSKRTHEVDFQIVQKALGYVKSFYDPSEFFRRPYFEGCLRGFIHALGEMKFIPRQTEYHICAVDFYILKKRRACVLVRLMLEEGFDVSYSGTMSEFEELFGIIESLPFEKGDFENGIERSEIE